MTRAPLWAAILLLWSNPGFTQEQPGYRIDTQKRQITVNTDKHWGQWLLGDLDQPIDSVRQDVLELRMKDGGGDALIVPREFRRQVDALTDAPGFSHVIDAKDEAQFISVFDEGGPRAPGGIKNAGSNLALAEGAIDRGDDRLETYWEPDLDEPSFKWWIEFDMGRLVSAEKIILRFVDEELGDPFLQFRVLVSTGLLKFDSSVRPLDYRTVGGTTRGIRDQREFTFDLEPDVKADPDFTGTPVQYVRIVVTDSNLDRAEEVTREVYENDLSPESRGRIEYHLKSFDGDVVPTTREAYETIETEEPDRLGPVRYYRRERPRLADVQVITAGDNIALGIFERGGKLTYQGTSPGVLANAFNGSFLDEWRARLVMPPGQSGTSDGGGGPLIIDLGALFWVDAFRILGDPRAAQYPLWGWTVRVSDGSTASDGTPIWNMVSPPERERNATTNRFIYAEDGFEPLRTRFIEFVHLDGSNTAPPTHVGVRAMQVFGEGRVAGVVLTSPLIEFKDRSNRRQAHALTRVEWVGETPPGTRIEVRTQTGNEVIPKWRFFLTNGTEVTRDKYWNRRTKPKDRGDSLATFSQGVDWSAWSRAYEHSGDRFISPSPRRFLRLQATLDSDWPDAVATLDSIIVHFTDPFASQVLAEVTPQIDVASGVPDTFSVFVRPIFRADEPDTSTRFDEIRVLASHRTEMELIEVRVGGQDALLAGEEAEVEEFGDDGQGGFVNSAGDRLEIISTRADTLWIRLPGFVDYDADSPPAYYRIAVARDEAPLDKSGGVLTEAAWSRLPTEPLNEQGRIDYFEVTATDPETGAQTLRLVNEGDYNELPFESQGPVRYYRALFDGEEVAIGNDGESLTRTSYNQLSSSQKGPVLREGEVVELRFRSRIFVSGTTFSAEVANSKEADTRIPELWQKADPGNAMEEIDGQGTAVITPIGDQPALSALEIGPNPFTPNGDGINDRVRLLLSVSNVDAPRRIEARFFTLAGVEVAVVSSMAAGGERVLEWHGRSGRDNAGELVAPGLYLCRVHVDSDAGSGNTLVRLVSLAF
jgi:hypothetical protein